MANEWLLVAAICLGLGQVESVVPSTQDAEIERAIGELSANRFEIRQAAMERLWAVGDPAIPALEQAVTNKNAEVRHRAQYVLDYLHMGIGADTPKTILREVQRFQTGSLEERRRAIQALESTARPRIILALLKSEGFERLRDEWYLSLEHSAMQAIAAGKLDDVADAVRRASDNEIWTRHWAAFAAQRGTTQSELARLEASPPSSEVELARMRAYLHRANGDMSEACRNAEHVSEDFLIALLVERRDWPQVAQRLAKQIPADLHQGVPEVSQLALAAAYARLAGDSPQESRYLGALKFHADVISGQIQKLNTNQVQQKKELVDRKWQFAKGLLLNGRFDEALTMLRPDRPLFVFEVLCEQHRYREAFELAGASYPNGLDEAWFRQLAQDSTDDAKVMEQRYPMGQLALRHLYFLGERDESQQYFQILLDSARADRLTGRLKWLCETAVRLSMRERALEIAELVIHKEERATVLSLLHPVRYSMATMWWEHFRERYATEKVEQTLHRVESVMIPRRFQESGGNIEQVVADAAVGVPKLLEARRTEWWQELGETCVMHGRRDLAIPYFEKAAESNSNVAIKLGDLMAADNQWEHAAQWYRKAWAFDPIRALPMYLHGRALMRAGQEKEGKRLADLAILMPMANAELRHELATGMKERGFRIEAKQQFELLLCTTFPLSDKTIDSAKQVGNLTYTQEPLHAADCWETMLLSCMRPAWQFIESGGYVQIPFLVHKTRSQGLLQAGRMKEGIGEAWIGLRVSPGNLELAEECVPLLDAANLRPEADELYTSSANVLLDLCRDFPQCATFHNNLAWLSARCDRQLDRALEHAQRAVALETNKAGFLDTLAEVHFRRGEVDLAIESAERCVKMEPGNLNYQQQLERFRGKKSLAGGSGE